MLTLTHFLNNSNVDIDCNFLNNNNVDISEDFCVARYCRHGEISGTTLAGLKLDRWILSINQTFRSTPIQGSSSVVICVQGKHFCTCFKGGGDGGGGKVNKGGGRKVKVTIECGIT